MFRIFAAIFVTSAIVPFTIDDNTKPFSVKDYLFWPSLVESYWDTFIVAAYPVYFRHK